MSRLPDSQLNTGLSGLVLLWGEPVFGPERPLRIFLQQIGAPLGPSLLWVDHWYSGVVTRTLSPFWQGDRRKIPPSFLFIPGEGPFPAGFVILPFRPGETEDLVTRLYDTAAGLSVTPLVLDSESLVPEVRPFVQDLSRNLLDRKDVRLHVSDPTAHPATYGCMAFAGVTP
ncbi:MAG: hypothetical protein M0Z25_06630 [Nitrospiraceae bacterium]|nr:hypothetical protein [Nitrospiraceae bacterium]